MVPGENGKVAFTSNRDGDYDIYAVEAGGSGLVQLTGNPGADDGPAWSPDGSRIAFVSCSDPSQDPIADPLGATSCEIYVMNADGSGQTRLTSNSAIDLMPAWSPDGTSIAYASGWDIWVMNADGSGQRNLTSTPVFGLIFGLEMAPDWSPDGRWIAYDGTVTGGVCVNELFLSDPVAATRVRLTQEATFCDNAASWSPDGAMLVFTRASATLAARELWTMPPAAGASPTRLTIDTIDDRQPAFSPDGQKIVFERCPAAGECDLYTIGRDGSGLAPLVTGSGDDAHATWAVATGPPACTIEGTAGADRLTGTPGPDVICGLGGNDSLDGAGGDDVLRGGAGNDRLVGGGGQDELYGERGRDTLLGRDGEADVLDGGPGKDKASRDKRLDVVAAIEKIL